jgi:hypothetical protein
MMHTMAAKVRHYFWVKGSARVLHMEVKFRYRGRYVKTRDIAFIQALVAEAPGVHLRALSKKLCEAWNVVQPNGALRGPAAFSEDPLPGGQLTVSGTSPGAWQSGPNEQAEPLVQGGFRLSDHKAFPFTRYFLSQVFERELETSHKNR